MNEDDKVKVITLLEEINKLSAWTIELINNNELLTSKQNIIVIEKRIKEVVKLSEK